MEAPEYEPGACVDALFWQALSFTFGGVFDRTGVRPQGVALCDATDGSLCSGSSAEGVWGSR